MHGPEETLKAGKATEEIKGISFSWLNQMPPTRNNPRLSVPQACETSRRGQGPREGSDVPGQTEELHTHFPAVHVLKQRS